MSIRIDRRRSVVDTVAVALAVALAVTVGVTVAPVSAGSPVRDAGAPTFFAVIVEDVDRAAAWYRATFGLHDLPGSEADDGSWRIANLRNDALFVELIRDPRAADVDRAHGFRKVGFGVPDVRLLADRVERATGERPRVLEFPDHGIRLLQLQDPEGNTIQILSPLDEEAKAQTPAAPEEPER